MNTGNERNEPHSATPAVALAMRRDRRTRTPATASRTDNRLAGRRVARKALLGAALAFVTLLSAACGGDNRAAEAPPGLATTAPGGAAPSLPGGGADFGQGPHVGPCYERPGTSQAITWLPADLPFPEGTYAISELQDDKRFRRAVLAVPMTYTEFVQFALAQWPAHGWILGRGESETGEAEDGFIRGDTYGAFRARRVYCEDGWSEILLALGEAPATTTTVTTE